MLFTMEKLISLNISLYISIVILSLLTTYIFNRGILGLIVKSFCNTYSTLAVFCFNTKQKNSSRRFESGQKVSKNFVLFLIFSIIMFVIYSFHLFNLLEMFIISIVLHTLIFSIISLELLGKDFKKRFNYLIAKRINLISIYYFLLILFIIYYIKNSVIHLDSNVIVTAKIDESTIKVSGEALNIIFNNLGSAGVFIAGTRIAAMLLTKSSMGILPKTGIIGSTGAGFTVTYRLVNQVIQVTPNNNTVATIQTGPVAVQIENYVDSGQTQILLEKTFNPNISGQRLRFIEQIRGNNREIFGNQEQTNQIIAELDRQIPNWRDTFINSPLESGNSLTQFVLEILNNNLILDLVTVYLLVMLLIILICKFIISKDIQFNRLNKYPLGSYINKLLVKYISIWQTSSNVWIFYILISLIIFNIASTFSIYHLIMVLS